METEHRLLSSKHNRESRACARDAGRWAVPGFTGSLLLLALTFPTIRHLDYFITTFRLMMITTET